MNLCGTTRCQVRRGWRGAPTDFSQLCCGRGVRSLHQGSSYLLLSVNQQLMVDEPGGLFRYRRPGVSPAAPVMVKMGTDLLMVHPVE